MSSRSRHALGTQGMSNDMSVSDAEEAFITQAWADGSMSVSMDPFGTPLDLQGEFETQDYSAQNWTQ